MRYGEKLFSPDKKAFLHEVWGDGFEARVASVGIVTAYAMAYIDENYHKVLSREKIAAYLDISPDYLSRLFQRECGMRLMAYIAAYRMYLGQKYLSEHPRMKVKDISLDVGISDADYFCRLFKKHTGLTPKEFRGRSLSVRTLI